MLLQVLGGPPGRAALLPFLECYSRRRLYRINCVTLCCSRSFGVYSPTLRVSCCHSRARLASGWLAFTGRDHYERFPVTWPSSSPVLLTLWDQHLIVELEGPSFISRI